MDRHKLSKIDEELASSEVEALCFLCLDVLDRKRLERIRDARQLFLGLEERGLLENQHFLSQLLRTIQRVDLVRFLETDSRQEEETDASPVLSKYRVMLYNVFEDMTEETLEKMKFLLKEILTRRQIEKSYTALGVFSELEKRQFLSEANVDRFHELLLNLDQRLASIVCNYKNETKQMSLVNMDEQSTQPQQPYLCKSGGRRSFGGQIVCTDAQPSMKPLPPSEEEELYPFIHNPRGLCVIINNETFDGTVLLKRRGTEKDEEALRCLFTKFGFKVITHTNLTSKSIRAEMNKLGQRSFKNEDALVVCVLSHGDKGFVYGTDEKGVALRELTFPFISSKAPSLAGKPKLFFIQACQGDGYQKGALACPPRVGQEEVQNSLEEDAGRVQGETIPNDADFLMGMATVENCKSFRSINTGSIYIQELCKSLAKSAESMPPDDLLSVLTRVNKEISRQDYTTYRHKQMPEPKYTLTKKVVLTYI